MGMSVSTIIKLCMVLAVPTDFILLGHSSGDGDALSVFSHMQQFSPQEQELV